MSDEALPSTRTVTVDGVRIACWEQGRGDPPLLFVHGWCCDHTYWAPQVAALSRDHRTVTLDLAGYGASDRPDRSYEMQRYAAELLGLAQALGLGRPVVVGHSMGGLIAFLAAAAAPERVRGIVLIDPAFGPEPPSPEAAQGYLAFAAALRGDGYQDLMRQFIEGSFFTAATPALVRQKVLAGMPTADHQVMASCFDGIIAAALALPEAIAVAGLWLAASKPVVGAPDMGAQVAARWPSLRFVQMPDVGHFVQLEAPSRVSELIRAFASGL